MPPDAATPLEAGAQTDAAFGGDAGGDASTDSGDASTDAGASNPTDDAGDDLDGGDDPEPPADLCPDDPLKDDPGQCGCGADESSAAQCAALSSALHHRYRFDGNGSVAVDSVSAADGDVINATLDGSGALTLAGTSSDQYVDLPDGLLSALSDATIEAWLDWQGGAAWQRLFDFGTSSNGAGNQGTGTTYLFFTPEASDGFMRLAFGLSGSGSETRVSGASALATGLRHVAVVVHDQTELRLYVDGALEGSVAWTGSLSAISDDNNWIGRSQYQTDDELAATVYEVRIYDAALSDADVAASFAAGPDPAFLP